MSAPFVIRVICAAFAVGLFVSPQLVTAQDLPQPTSHHKQLAREAGVWAATSKFWMAPGAQPMVSKGKETCTMLGGFWLTSKYEGQFAGVPFTGLGQTGYDEEKGEYVSTWIDNMSPGLLVSRGKYDAATHTLTLVGEGRDTMTGKLKQMKMTVHYQDDNHKHFEIHEAKPGGDQWVKVMEINYVREK